MKKKNKVKLVPPDGGWGWLVVLGVAITQMTNQSLISIFSLLFGDTLDEMGYGTTGAALISNIMSAVTNFSGLITGPMIRRFSFRKAVIVGGLLTSSGMILTSEASHLWHFLFTYSFLTGLGLGFLLPSNFVAVNAYFTTQKGRAVGYSLAGTGIGQMVMPHVVRYLLEDYGFRGTVLFIGGLTLHALVGAALFEPVKLHMKRVPLDEEDDELLTHLDESVVHIEEDKPHKLKRNYSNVSLISLTSVELGEKNALDVNDMKHIHHHNYKHIHLNEDVKRSHHNSMELVHVNEDKKHTDQNSNNITHINGKIESGKTEQLSGDSKVAEEDNKSLSCWQSVISFMDLDLLKDVGFVNLIVGLAIVYTAGVNFSMLYPFYLHSSVGLSLGDTATCMSVLAAFDIASRLVVPQITDRIKASTRSTFLVNAFLLAAARSAIAETRNFIALLVISAICGFVRGTTVTNLNLAISEHCTTEKLPTALGINMVFKGVFILTFGPLVGYIRDTTGSFTLIIHLLSIMVVIPMCLWVLEIILKRRQR